VPVWFAPAARLRQRHGRRDDRVKELPWPRTSPARSGGAGGLLAAPGRRVPRLDPGRHRGRRHRQPVRRRSAPPPSAEGGVNLQPAPGPFVLVALANFTYFHATSAGQSIGNKILEIRVLDAGTGRPLPCARAFVRALVRNLSALAFFLGFLWMLWEPRKRTWHDIVADSLVVRTSVYPPGEFGRRPAPSQAP
jgi:hypothetical protein